MAMQRRFQFISDRELVEIAQLGSLEACDELVHRYRGAAILVAEQTLGSREAAQDVAQEAFLLAFRALPTLQDPAKFASWLRAITRNRARRVAQKEGRSEPAESSDLERLMTPDSGPQAASPLDALLHAETKASVHALLEELPPELQVILRLFHFEQWPAARIADFLSLPLTTVKWRLRFGRQRLYRRLSELMGEETHVQTQSRKRDTGNAESAAKDGRHGRTRRSDRPLRKRGAQLPEAVQCHCEPS